MIRELGSRLLENQQIFKNCYFDKCNLSENIYSQ